MPRSKSYWLLFVCASCLIACSDSAAKGGGKTTPDSGAADAAVAADAAKPIPNSVDPLVLVPPSQLKVDKAKVCPGKWATQAPVVCKKTNPLANYEYCEVSSRNEGFKSDGQTRSFYLFLPDFKMFKGPRPTFVSLTGTVQTEDVFVTAAHLDRLTSKGWIVVAPTRNGNGPAGNPISPCKDGPGCGKPPWAGYGPAVANPDTIFFRELVTCMAGHYSIDSKRIYVGGHSAGGDMTYMALNVDSDFYAGGIGASGGMHSTSKKLGDMIVIVYWGGKGDQYTPSQPSGCPGSIVCQPTSVKYDIFAGQLSKFYDEQANVQQVNCHAEVGHAWDTGATNFMVDTLLQYPKGMPKALKFPGTPEEYLAREPDKECDPEKAPAYIHVPGCPFSCTTDRYNGP